jgi:hypothetical protein
LDLGAASVADDDDVLGFCCSISKGIRIEILSLIVSFLHEAQKLLKIF